MEVRAVALFDVERVDVDLALVLVRVGEDVTLVEQARVGLFRRQVPEVVQHLVPEAGIQQVQHGVLDAADVEVDAAGVIGPNVGARAHPVRLDGRVDEHLVVRRVGVAQLVPARARPLRHHVGVAPVQLRPVAEVELDVHPRFESIERALRVGELVVGVERARREAVGVRAARRGASRRAARAAGRPRRTRSGTAHPSSAGG